MRALWMIPAAFAASGALAGSQPTESAAREACRQFLSRSAYVVKDWGEYWNWAAVDNKDGTWRVGMRVKGAAPGGDVRNLYITCVTAQKGDSWQVLRMSKTA